MHHIKRTSFFYDNVKIVLKESCINYDASSRQNGLFILFPKSFNTSFWKKTNKQVRFENARNLSHEFFRPILTRKFNKILKYIFKEK